jgi:TetR/AcrR family transcriptional regulator, cholesterol catabolism regulator
VKKKPSSPTAPAQLAGSPLLAKNPDQRRFTPAQLDRRQRLCRAARELAETGGYTAVTMRAVALQANVGLATVYRYFSSKDHLIADIHAMKSVEILQQLQNKPPSGETVYQRLAAVFDRLLEVTVEQTKLSAAGVAAICSGDPNANSPLYWQHLVMVPYIEVALGEEDMGDRRELGELLGHLFFSLMVNLTTGRLDLESAKGIMRRGIKRMLAA